MDGRALANNSTPGGRPNPPPDALATVTGSSSTPGAGLSNETTAAPTPARYDGSDEDDDASLEERLGPSEKGFKEQEDAIGGFEPLKTATNTKSQPQPLSRKGSKINEDDLFRALTRRKTGESMTSEITHEDEQAEIERLMSRMFGRTRQAHSAEEKTRHVGVVFKNLTVRGVGLGAALQPTTGDVFMGLPRLLKGLFGGGPRAVSKKENVREILSDFTGCIKPGEMVLVLGRPGSGCSTFLKVLGNQRFGYVSVDGEVTYGGTDAKLMGKDFRGEVEPRCPHRIVVLTHSGPL